MKRPNKKGLLLTIMIVVAACVLIGRYLRQHSPFAKHVTVKREMRPTTTFHQYIDNLSTAPPSGTGDSASESAQSIFLAAGEFIKVYPDEPFGVAEFRITEVLAGHFETNVIAVSFAAATLKKPLPQRALLLVAPLATSDGFAALGYDANRGIIPDTPENRKRAENLEDLAEEIERGAPHEADVIEIVMQHLVNVGESVEGLEFRAKRMAFCWGVLVFQPTPDGQIRTSQRIFLVSDEGDIIATLLGH